MSLIQTLDLQSMGDDRGKLVIIEGLNQVPFQIKRVYYLQNMKSDLPRGFHAHKKCVQAAICIQGSCEMHMDDGINKEVFVMNNSKQALLIGTMQWHEMHNFSSDCILMVMASETYDESDYIRTYKGFLEELSNG